MPINYYIFLSLTLFTIGIVGILIRRNAIIVFMCIEIMLNAVNLLLVAFSKMHHLQGAAAMPTGGNRWADFCFFYHGSGSSGSNGGVGHHCYDVPEYSFY